MYIIHNHFIHTYMCIYIYIHPGFNFSPPCTFDIPGQASGASYFLDPKIQRRDGRPLIRRTINPWILEYTNPICSMYGIFTNICPKNHPNAGKYIVHGAYGNDKATCSSQNLKVTPMSSGEVIPASQPNDWKFKI